MQQGNLATEKITRVYLAVLREAILNLRMRIRYGETIDMREVHDLLDAVHNIPEMLCAYGNWHVEENINQDLGHYDRKWYTEGSDAMRSSLMKTLADEMERLTSLGEDHLPRSPDV